MCVCGVCVYCRCVLCVFVVLVGLVSVCVCVRCAFSASDYCVLLTINMLCHVEVMFIQLLNLLERYRKNSHTNFPLICSYL